jgi:hypothetical protein
MRRPCPTSGCCAMEKKNCTSDVTILITYSVYSTQCRTRCLERNKHHAYHTRHEHGQRTMSWFVDKGKGIIAERCFSVILVRHKYRNMPPSPCAHFHSCFISVQFCAPFKTRPLSFFLNTVLSFSAPILTFCAKCVVYW